MHSGKDVFSRLTSVGSTTLEDMSRQATSLTIGASTFSMTNLDTCSRESTPLAGFLSALKRYDKTRPAGDNASPCTCSMADVSPSSTADTSPLEHGGFPFWVDSWFELEESQVPTDLAKDMTPFEREALCEASSRLLDSCFQVEAESMQRCAHDKSPILVDSWFAAPEEFLSKEQATSSGSAKLKSLTLHQLQVASSCMMESHFQLESAHADLITGTSDDMWEWHIGRTHAGELNISSDDMWEWHTGRTHAGELNISSDDMWEWHTGHTHAA
eukprot:TRINITY_DN6078_c0_g1_i1.p1 TRINITY_DN6078_c0_g1~~TRINITY_DN6078_c0_g1_i1.p1  ORF type:complete len:304 (+),score=45.75 TRINITY_DN6078_c0_g1_i1:98-913(+)